MPEVQPGDEALLDYERGAVGVLKVEHAITDGDPLGSEHCKGRHIGSEVPVVPEVLGAVWCKVGAVVSRCR